MRENFSIDEILEAVNLLLNSKTKKKLNNKSKKIHEKKNDLLPIDTEKIISQAEKYMKKK